MNTTKVGLVVLIIIDVAIVMSLYYVTLSSIPSVHIAATEDSDSTHGTEKNSDSTQGTKKTPIGEEKEDNKTDVTRDSTNSLQSYILDTFVEYLNYSITQGVRFQKRDAAWIPKKNQCPATPPNLVGKMKVPVEGNAPTWDNITALNPHVKQGSFAPPDCTARFRIAIIIPIRDREAHLRVLLHHLHPILQRQQVDYSVYTISLAGTGVFNRAKLMNAGFIEANRDREYDCYIFHDVDLLLEDDGCLYWCDEKPRQIAFHMNKFGYHPLSYQLGCRPTNAPKVNKYFGGVAMVPHNLFVQVNGFSNIFWGWGGEDDDMYSRIWSTGTDIVNPYGRKCSFSMIKHEREGTNRVNPARFALLYYSILRKENEGLNTVRYKKIAVDRKNLYINITVDIGERSDRMKDFMNSKFNTKPCYKVKMPWE